jgi:alpha-mannosidase
VPVSRYTVAAWFSDLPPCGYRTYHAHLVARMPRQSRGLTFPGGLQNGHLRVTVRPDGSLRLDTAGLSFEPLHFFRDEGDIGDQYNYIKPLNDIVVETLSSRASVRVLHDGPALGELEVTVQARLPLAAAASRETRSTQTCEVPISSRLRLWKEARRLEVQTRLHNTVKDHRLRAVFPLGADIRSVRADTAFGVIDRPLEIPAHWGFASRDRPHRSFFEARDKGRGLAVLSRGLYEHDARPDGQLELTLLRSVGHMFVDFHSYAPLDPVEGGQCPGEHTFDYALLAHDGDLPLEQLVEEAAAFNAPLRVYQTDLHAGTLPHSMSFLSLTPTALQLSAVKPAADRDSVIVRLYNATAEPVSGRLELAGTWAHAFETNLDETRLRELHLTGSSLSLALAPWQILTVELEGYR